MAKITMMIGFVLFAVGLAFWGITGRVAPTALLPSCFGLALMVCGALAKQERRRKLFMHIAVTIGLLAFLAPVIRAAMVWAAVRAGNGAVSPMALTEQLLTACVSLGYVLLCVRSFRKARAARVEPVESAA